jgi:hypothetical protein
VSSKFFDVMFLFPLYYAMYTQYYSTAKEIHEESQIRAASAFGTILAWSNTATTFALALPSVEWPFVTLPHMEEWAGGKSFELAGILSLSFCVLVPEHQGMAWSDFAKNQSSSTQVVVTDTPDKEADFSAPFIWRHGKNASTRVAVTKAIEGYTDFAVSWQTIPYDATMINHDEFELPHVAELVSDMKTHHNGAFSELVPHDQGYSSFYLRPVLKSFLSEEESDKDAQIDVVGYLKAQLAWDHYYQDLLPDGAAGIHVVVTSQCFGAEYALTYELVGTEVVLLGLGDLHEVAWDHMGVEERFDPAALLVDGDEDEASSDSEDDKVSVESEDNEADDHEEVSGCSYTVIVYPSSTYHDQYKSKQPAVYTAFGVLVIFCAAAVFMVYDWFVQRRQKRLISIANEQAHALVNR